MNTVQNISIVGKVSRPMRLNSNRSRGGVRASATTSDARKSAGARSQKDGRVRPYRDTSGTIGKCGGSILVLNLRCAILSSDTVRRYDNHYVE